MRCIIALTLALMTPAITAQAQAQAPAAGARSSYQVVRLGDNSMSCANLIAEINALNAESQATQSRLMETSSEISREALAAARSGGMGGLGMMGGMGGLGGLAASFIPGADLLTGALSSISAAAQEAQISRQQDRMMENMEQAMIDIADTGPMMQRVEHLSEISRSKAC